MSLGLVSFIILGGITEEGELNFSVYFGIYLGE
jgi:hypothetical protein